MKTTHAKVEFARLPKDYTGLCRILTPRFIRDEVEFQNVTGNHRRDGRAQAHARPGGLL